MSFTHQAGLLIHFVGIFFIAGGLIGNMVTEAMLWKQIKSNTKFSENFVQALTRFSTIVIVGALLMIASGTLMLSSMNWVLFGQFWFQFKLGIFITLVLNGNTTGRFTLSSLRKETSAESPSMPVIIRLVKRLRIFHLVQCILVGTLITLTVFRW